MQIQQKIHEQIKKLLPNYLDLLKKVVNCPSEQGNELEVQNIIEDHLKELGFEVEKWSLNEKRLKESPYFFSNREHFQNSPNVVGVLKGSNTSEGKSLILNGHVDVVPVGDLKRWTVEPYQSEIKGNRIYGRGVTDMKGANIAMLLAIDALLHNDVNLKGDLIFQSVVEEESGGAGTLDACLKGYKADAALIPEPSQMKIFPKQQGSKWFKINVKGYTAHGGTRYFGISAIEKATIVIEHILEFERIKNKQIKEELYKGIELPVPINIGKIYGGDWPSSVPDLVTLEGRFGIAPSDEIEEAQLEFEKWMENIKEKDAWFKDNPIELEWFGARWIPNDIDVEHPLIKLLEKNYESVIGKKATLEAAPWGTDGGLLTKVADTPAIIFGPGVTNMAHAPDEWLDINDFEKFAEIVANTIIEWCGMD